MKKTWTAYVQQEGEDFILPFPKGLLEELGWEEGDVLVWDMRGDGTIVLTKKMPWYKVMWSRFLNWKK